MTLHAEWGIHKKTGNAYIKSGALRNELVFGASCVLNRLNGDVPKFSMFVSNFYNRKADIVLVRDELQTCNISGFVFYNIISLADNCECIHKQEAILCGEAMQNWLGLVPKIISIKLKTD